MVADKAVEKAAPKAEEKVEDKPTVKVEEPEVEVKKETPAKTDAVAKPAEATEKAKNDKAEDEKPKPEETAAAAADTSKSEDAATLILSAEEEAEISAQTSEEAVKDTDSAKKRPQKNVWVSNITRATKAADLKKLFSDKFKVETARIVTNGKTVFGYICLETPAMAESAVKDLNGATLDGKKVCVSLTRPDLRRTTDSNSKRTRDRKDNRSTTNGVTKSGDKAGDEKKKVEEKKGSTKAEKDTQESGSAVGNDDKKKEENPAEELARLRRRDARLNRLVEELKTDVKRLNTELQNNRRRLASTQRRFDLEREQKTSIRREVHTLQDQLKSEKRKYTQEIEILEKKRKLDEIRYQDDRAILSRELDECRKLREYLQRKIDDVAMVRHQRASPPRRSSSDKIARPRHSDGRPNARSPPPPPKINPNRRSRERSPYKGNKKPRVDDHHSSYGSNHYTPNPSSYSGGAKPLLGYPQSGGSQRMTSSFSGAGSYQEPHRFGSSGYQPSGGFMGSGSNSNSLMGRPMGYPNSSGGPRKY